MTHEHHPHTSENPKRGCGSGCGCHHSQEEPSETETPKPQASPEEDYKDKYLRLLAENENLRRRVQRESQEAIRFAIQKVMLDLLDPYDHFEKALEYADQSPSEEVRNWGLGFKMIHQQFKEWLNAQGVFSYPSKGQTFSAELHEAVEVKTSTDHPEGLVIEELFKGYKIHDRVLRHAKVVITQRPKEHTQAVQDAESELDLDALKKHSSH